MCNATGQYARDLFKQNTCGAEGARGWEEGPDGVGALLFFFAIPIARTGSVLQAAHPSNNPPFFQRYRLHRQAHGFYQGHAFQPRLHLAIIQRYGAR